MYRKPVVTPRYGKAMGRNSLVTEKQVHDFADDLAASGVKPSTTNLLAHFGVGSKSTYSKHLRSWEDKQLKTELAFSVLPPAITQTLTTFVAQEIAAATAVITANLANFRQENLDLIKDADRQIAAIEALEMELQIVNNGKAELMGRISELTSHLVAAQSKTEEYRAVAENSRILLAGVKADAERLSKLEIELDAARTAKSLAEKNEAVAVDRLQQMGVVVVDLQQRLISAEEEVRKVRT